MFVSKSQLANTKHSSNGKTLTAVYSSVINGRPAAIAGRRPLICFTAVVDFLFFRRLISEVAWPIVTKLYHMFDGDPDL